MVCNTLCEGLGDTTQFAVFDDLLQIWSWFFSSENSVNKDILQPDLILTCDAEVATTVKAVL